MKRTSFAEHKHGNELHYSLSAQPSHSMGRKHSFFMFHSSHTKQILTRDLQFCHSGPSPIHTNLCTVHFRADSTVAELDSPPGQSRECKVKNSCKGNATKGEWVAIMEGHTCTNTVLLPLKKNFATPLSWSPTPTPCLKT